MSKITIMQVVGARPNFIKLASINHILRNDKDIDSIIVHTGQHFDENMSKIFFEELDIPKPDINLEVPPGPHGAVTGEIMKRIEPVIMDKKPDLVLVVGDVNSTVAAAVVAAKLGIKVAHVEAGLRSFDRSMPEEINRVLTDSISDYLFVTEKSGMNNLKKEGIPDEKVFFVGNVMIDTLLKHKEKAEKSDILSKLGLENPKVSKSKPGKPIPDLVQYSILTLHRPSNVDSKDIFTKLSEVFIEISKKIPIIFPTHPRTQQKIKYFGLEANFREISINLMKDSMKYPLKTGIYMIPPLGYLDFLKLMSHAKFIMTDSGGIQEETTALGVPCITLRENTERPVTVESGNNVLVGHDYPLFLQKAQEYIFPKSNKTNIPELWDGNTASRIITILKDKLSSK